MINTPLESLHIQLSKIVSFGRFISVTSINLRLKPNALLSRDVISVLFRGTKPKLCRACYFVCMCIVQISVARYVHIISYYITDNLSLIFPYKFGGKCSLSPSNDVSVAKDRFSVLRN